MVLLPAILLRKPASAPSGETPQPKESVTTKTIAIDDEQFTVEVADEPIEQQKGLSGRKTLDSRSGMLFVFDVPAQQCFWMKDTLIPLDMLWFDESYKLIHIEQNVQPDSYPKNFCPNTDAKYVVELSAGSTARNNLKIGNILKLN